MPRKELFLHGKSLESRRQNPKVPVQPLRGCEPVQGRPSRVTGTRGGHWEPEGGRGTGPRGWGVTSAVFQQFSSPSCCLCPADLGRRFGFAALPGTNTCWALPKAGGGAGGIGSAFLGCVLRQTPGPCFQLLLGKAELIPGKGGCGRLAQRPGERRGGICAFS